MARDLPRIGEQYLGDDPAPLKVEKVTVYVTAATAPGDTDAVCVATSDDATGTYNLFYVPAGLVVYDVLLNKRTATNASIDMTIGTSTDPDAFFGATGVDASTVGWERCTAHSCAAKGGYHFGTDGDGGTFATSANYQGAKDTIVLALTQKGQTAGLMDVYLVYAMAGSQM